MRAFRPGIEPRRSPLLREPAQALSESLPGVSSATLSQSSIISAGVAGGTYIGKMKIGAVTIAGAGRHAAGPRFLTTMQVPILAGREIDERDQAGPSGGQ